MKNRTFRKSGEFRDLNNVGYLRDRRNSDISKTRIDLKGK